MPKGVERMRWAHNVELVQHLQIRVDFAAENAANEILGIGIVPPEMQNE